MKKIFTLVAAALTAATFTANAEVLLTDNFEYPAGNLLNEGLTNGNWLHYAAQTGAPIQLVDQALTYDGFQSSPVGKAVRLTSGGDGQDAMVKFADEPIVATSGTTIYAAFLMNVEDLVTASTFSFSFLAPGTSATGTSAVKDGGLPSEIGRLLIGAGSTADKYTVRVSRNTISNIQTSKEEFNFGETYLVVLAYEWVEGTKNDVVKVFMNPTDFKNEPEPTVKTNDASSSDAARLQAFELRQPANAGVTNGPNLTVDALRIATSWSELFPPVTAVTDLNVEKVNSVRKYVENGQVVIENNGVKYNIAGQVIK